MIILMTDLDSAISMETQQTVVYLNNEANILKYDYFR